MAAKVDLPCALWWLFTVIIITTISSSISITIVILFFIFIIITVILLFFNFYYFYFILLIFLIFIFLIVALCLLSFLSFLYLHLVCLADNTKKSNLEELYIRPELLNCLKNGKARKSRRQEQKPKLPNEMLHDFFGRNFTFSSSVYYNTENNSDDHGERSTHFGTSLDLSQILLMFVSCTENVVWTYRGERNSTTEILECKKKSQGKR